MRPLCREKRTPGRYTPRSQLLLARRGETAFIRNFIRKRVNIVLLLSRGTDPIDLPFLSTRRRVGSSRVRFTSSKKKAFTAPIINVDLADFYVQPEVFEALREICRHEKRSRSL